MTTRVVCPRCQAVLSIREDAPARMTCLRCLAAVVNPNLVQRETAVPAIPIDNEIQSDLGGAGYVIMLLGGGLIVAGGLTAWGAGSLILAAFTIVAGLVVLAVGLILYGGAKQRLERRQREAVQGTLPDREGSVLEYQPLEQGRTTARTPFAVQATFGFVVWVLLVFLIAYGMRAQRGTPLYRLTSDPQSGLLLIAACLVVLILVSVWLRMKYDWRGFVPGLLLGLGVTCLLPVGILLVVCGGMLK